MFFGLIPLKLFSTVRDNSDARSRSRWKTVISFANCFSGGVFMAACLLDVFPESTEQIDRVLERIMKDNNIDIHFPWPEFIMVLGVFLILFIEQTVLTFQVVSQSNMLDIRSFFFSRSAGQQNKKRRSHC